LSDALSFLLLRCRYYGGPLHPLSYGLCLLFFLNDASTTEIYTLSLHDALPIFGGFCRRLQRQPAFEQGLRREAVGRGLVGRIGLDRKSTRLNSSHEWISYAVFCLKKKTAPWI